LPVVALALAEQKLIMEQVHKAAVSKLQNQLAAQELAYSDLQRRLTREKELAVAETKKKQWVSCCSSSSHLTLYTGKL